MKNAIENMDIRLDQGEERICVEDTSLQIILSEKNKEKRIKKREESLCEQ